MHLLVAWDFSMSRHLRKVSRKNLMHRIVLKKMKQRVGLTNRVTPLVLTLVPLLPALLRRGITEALRELALKTPPMMMMTPVRDRLVVDYIKETDTLFGGPNIRIDYG